MQLKTNKRGFTIIELIVVIAIISVLAAIVIVGVVQYINKARDASVKSNLAQIAKTLQIYFSSHSNYDSLTQNPEINFPCNQSSYGINKSSNQYAIYAKMCSKDHYLCLDSTGKSVEQTDAPIGTICEGVLCTSDCVGECQICDLGSASCINSDSKCDAIYGPGYYCNAGTCALTCDPVANCQGKTCGDDGCGTGGTCGSCSGDCGTCNESIGQCEPDSRCTADCKTCSIDGSIGICTGGCLGGSSCSQCDSISGNCYDNTCYTNCQTCNMTTGSCEGGCPGCQSCGGSGPDSCYDNSMNCSSMDCLTCSGSQCVSTCSGCQSCNGMGNCNDDNSKCSGCKSCNAGSCVDDNNRCNYWNCESCIDGSCNPCPGCQSCNGGGPGGCYDNSMNCNWYNCEDCNGGSCQNRCSNWGQNCDGWGGCY